jgi:thiol-disulfide isomerase/thioredoxin
VNKTYFKYSTPLILILIVILIWFMSQRYNHQNNLYSRQITLDQLESKVQNPNGFYVYYFQPNCTPCQRVSPYLIPMGEQQSVEFRPINVAKYKDAWIKFNISETPTLVYYKNGKEIKRIEGEHTKEEYKAFFSN